MVGIVIVSHSQKLAEGVKELAEMMAHDVHIEAAGGLEEGLLGTSFERVKVAIEDVCGADGAVVLMDMGSAVMTAELAVEECRDEAVRLVDCPIAEGAVLAAVAAANGADLSEVVRQAESARQFAKMENPSA
ncbi:dihydroxyacetone kinase phosphoryl donor subunit DhaM [Mitsuokella sp.]|uniref:dihydroxyacetone kinase phosphoryl donor subunit DhaM n=1 Tax=unclassified Mitsuokella TaxID=2637239 RepID=UPI003D7E2F3E